MPTNPRSRNLGHRDQVFADYVSHWLELRRKSRAIERLHDRWIRGQSPSREQPRWSVIRNVLGWVD